MKHRILSGLLAVSITLALTACGKDDKKSSAPAQSTPAASSVNKPASSGGGTQASQPAGSESPAPAESKPTDSVPEDRPAQSADFSVRFGDVVITEMPVSPEVLVNDGWTLPVQPDGDFYYAEKDGYEIGFTYTDNTETMIETLVISSGTFSRGSYDISLITLFGSVDFASAASAMDISRAYDPDGSLMDTDYFFSDMDDFRYVMEFTGIKSCPYFALTRQDETIFSITMSAADNSVDNDTSGGGSAGEPPMYKEERVYQADYNESLKIVVRIREDGSWEMEQERRGAEDIYAFYSFEEEAAGKYVQVSGYNLAVDPPEPVYLGHARFRMSEAVLIVEYQDGDVTEYHRIHE